MEPYIDILWNLFIALAIGLLIGIERGWSDREEKEGDRVAGIRTFSLVGLLGGIGGEVSKVVGDWILAVLFAALAALSIASYVIEIRAKGKEDIGITTEITLLLTFLLGAWTVYGYHIYALAAATVVIAILNLKPVLHRWLRMIEMKEIDAGIKFLIISIILLPLLPDRGYGPWEAVNPYWIWWMVVLISGISFTGYILIRYAGEDKGTLLTALTGGLVSSTAVTLSLAQLSRQQKHAVGHVFIIGVLIASVIMFIRVGVEVAVVNPSLLNRLWIPLAIMLVLSILGGLWLWKEHREIEKESPVIALKNPLQFLTALKFGLILGVILLLVSAIQQWYGDKGVLILSFLSGLMDVDAITLSLSRLAKDSITSTTAVTGIVISVITNTLVKTGLFMFWAGFQKSKTLIWITLIVCTGGVLGLLPFFW